MRIRILNWVVCLLIVYITVMIMRDTYFYISPQAKQFESTIVDAYMQIPYPTGTVITEPFELWRKAEHRWLSYRCKSLLTPVELTAFYDDFFGSLSNVVEKYYRKISGCLCSSALPCFVIEHIENAAAKVFKVPESIADTL